ncbi:MAG: carbamoyltransferase family protein [Bryobacteraceae bacterium]
MNILGIGGVLGDAATAILRDGHLAAAIEEAKIARRGRPGGLPERSIAACLQLAALDPNDIDCVALVRPISNSPEATLHLELRARFPRSRTILIEHHVAHAASAFYASPFAQAKVVTLDRAGDLRCGAVWHGDQNRLALENEFYYPDSLGGLYGRVTQLLGFSANADEHKVQWLSVAGEPRFRDLFLDMLFAGEGATPQLDSAFFDAARLSNGGFSGKFFARLGLGDSAPIPDEMRADIAASLQLAIEETVLRIAGKGANLCLAGGLGLNALLVSALERSGRFDEVFVQPAAGNSGTALGALLYAWHEVFQQSARIDLENYCLGPSFQAEEIKRVLENCKLRFRYLLTTGELVETAVQQLLENKILAWMHGRMEFGPRALGNRSILASPLDPYSTENLNAYIKHRESFRKFAASVPAEAAEEYFEAGPNARFLATVGRVKPSYREKFKAAILADDLIRVHVVSREDNPLYWNLLHAAGKKTGMPVLYNTSFNLFGEPLVCTPRDAVRSFYSSGIDAMFVGNFFLRK